MVLTEKSTKTIQACRFCSMCRHMCPLGLALGKELNNPRAKALLLQLVERGAVAESEIAGDIYECCLCNACADNCETGYEPQIFIREVRSQLFAAGLAPKEVEKAVDSLLELGTSYAMTPEQTLSDYSLPQTTGAAVLVYAGACAAVEDRPMVEAVLSLLDKAGVSYSVFRENLSSGSVEYDLIGQVQEVKAIAQACAQALNATGAGEILVLNPNDARMLLQEYTNWGIHLTATVHTITSYVEKLVLDGKLTVAKASGTVTLHDPERLSRDLQETEPARTLLSRMGYTIKEMWQSKNLTRSTGGEALASYAPEIIRKTAAARMADAVGTGAEALVVVDPVSQIQLAQADGIPVENLFVLLDKQTH